MQNACAPSQNTVARFGNCLEWEITRWCFRFSLRRFVIKWSRFLCPVLYPYGLSSTDDLMWCTCCCYVKICKVFEEKGNFSLLWYSGVATFVGYFWFWRTEDAVRAYDDSSAWFVYSRGTAVVNDSPSFVWVNKKRTMSKARRAVQNSSKQWSLSTRDSLS